MAATTTIEDLPDDVLVEIFSYFTFSHLMKSVQYVCQRWKDVVQFSDLWTNLTYIANEYRMNTEVTTMLRRAPKLRTLNLKNGPFDYSVLRGVLDHCHNLRRLELSGLRTLRIGFLNSLLQECPIIEYLHIPNEVIHKEECSEVIARFENLHTLVVGKVTAGCWEYPAVLKPLADGCPALQRLDLRELHTHDDLGYFLDKKKDQLISLTVGWTSADSININPLLVFCRSLKCLHIIDFGDDDWDVESNPKFEPFKFLSAGITSLTLTNPYYTSLSIVDIFGNKAMRHLTELRISDYEDCSGQVGKVIENCPHLTLLHLINFYGLSDSSVETVCTLQDLQNLNLSGSSLRFMENISKCEGLKFLDLSDCQELEVDIDLFHLKNLQVLNLSKCDVGRLPLHLLPSTLKRLRVLDLMYSENVDEESLTNLKRLMPHLLIKYKKYPFPWHDDSNVVFTCPPIYEPTLGEASQA